MTNSKIWTTAIIVLAGLTCLIVGFALAKDGVMDNRVTLYEH